MYEGEAFVNLYKFTYLYILLTYISIRKIME